MREGFGLPAFRCSHREGGAGIAAVDPCAGIFRASSRSVGIAIVAPSGIGTRCGAGESRRAVRGAAVQNIRLRIKVAGSVRGLSFCLCVFRRGRPMRRCTAGRSRKIQEVAGARRFSLASGACRKIAPTIGQASTSRQSPQVESPFSDTHLRIRHKSLQIGEFHSLRAAARTMDGRGRDLRGIVHFAPFPGGALPKGVVVVDGSPAGVAVFALQAAAGNQSFHHFCLFSECPPPLRDKSGGQGRLGRRHRNLFCCGAGQGRLRPLYRDDVREADRVSRANRAFARGGGFSGCGRVLGFGRATAG